MTIRKRLTFWYGGILLVSLVVMAGVLHFELREQRQPLLEGKQPLEPVWEEVAEVMVMYGIPTALLLLVGGGWLMRKALTPVTTLTRAAERMHVDNLHERLPRTGNGDELDRLTEVFNAMMARLEDSFARVREFTLHASHEMKTPLAILHNEVETLLNHPSSTPAQREVFASQLDEIQRLTKIVESLTFLAKADAGQVALANEPVRLDELVQDAFVDAQMLARSRQIVVDLAACEEGVVRGDRHRLRQLLLNLTDNAIKYNVAKGRVTLALRCNGHVAALTVTNTGPGIPAELLPRVFDRFFRCDLAHGSELEGSGLGLSIAQWVVKAHAGCIEITSEPEATAVTVTLPSEAR